MSQSVMFFLAGLVLIIVGGDWFVGASIRLAELLRMPRVVVGTTLVSLATTSPELVVSITAGLQHEPGLAVGNAVGSCVCNIGLILGAAAALKSIPVQPLSLLRPTFAMFFFGWLLFFLTLDLGLHRRQAWLLIALGLAYFTWDFLKHNRERLEAGRDPASGVDTCGRFPWLCTPWGAAFQFLGSAVVVVGGSRLLVEGAVGLAQILGIKPIIIGLTVVAIGTSLPELITGLASSRKNVADLSVGNVLGANIANLTLVVGAAAALQDVRMDRATQVFSFPAMLVAMALFVLVVVTGNRVTRREGYLLLIAYGLYLAGVVEVAVFAKR